jgi:hypothetical protein
VTRPRGQAFPTVRQEALIRAAVLEGGAARSAWKQWQALGGDVDRIDGASYGLLPQAYRNLAAIAPEEPLIGKLKSVYRYHWYRNQVLLHGAAEAVRVLEAAGIPTLVLKGAALAILHYRDAGARPMEDVDVLVPRDRARDAMRVLRAAGFSPAFPAPEAKIGVRHAETFVSPGDHAVDLHWWALWQPSRDDDLWRNAVGFELGGERTRALAPAHQLLQVPVHGLRTQETPALRWIPDALLVLRSSRGAVDWEALVAAARTRQLTTHLGAALSYLRETFAAPIPEDVLDRLAASPSSLLERWTYRAAVMPPPRATRVLLHVDRYRRLRALGDPDGRMGFVRFWARSRGLERAGQLPANVVRRYVEHLRARGATS